MSDIDSAISKLRELSIPVPKQLRLPNEEEVRDIEESTGISFPPDFRRYLMEASHVWFGQISPVTITNVNAHTHFPTVLDFARQSGVPSELIPLCEDNSDFYCVSQSGEVVFWGHNGKTGEHWPTIASWIEDVWIGEALQ